MTEKIKNPPQGAAQFIAAIGERGTVATLALTNIDSLSARVGGNVNAIRLDKQTAIFFNSGKQTETMLDPCNLNGTLALCAVDRDGKPTNTLTAKQVAKYSKLFRRSGNNKERRS